MADALCGPSNPLQSFQKHTSVDRTLQQDRLRSRPTPGQGFRSLDPRATSVDADFAAFEAGPSFQSFAPQSPFAQTPHPGVPVARQFQPQPESSPAWASDFQKLRLGGPSQPVPQSQFRAEAPLFRSQAGGAGWHDEFVRQQQQRQISPVTAPQQSYNNLHYGGFQGQMPMAYNGFEGSQLSYSQQTSLEQPNTMQHEHTDMDDAAFENAFAQAEDEQDLREQQLRAQVLAYRASNREGHQGSDDLAQTEQIRIGSDLIGERDTQQDNKQNKTEADDLARTAGELLNALKHDQSEKFQQSQFLSLMRRIRDREVEVDGDDFAKDYMKPCTNCGLTLYQTSKKASTARDDIQDHQDLHPGGRFYPEQSPPPTSTNMSGAVTAEDAAIDTIRESASLADRFDRSNKVMAVDLGGGTSNVGQFEVDHPTA